jgi:hypothetical protein
MIPLSHLLNLVPKKGVKVLELTHLALVNTVFLAVLSMLLNMQELEMDFLLISNLSDETLFNF